MNESHHDSALIGICLYAETHIIVRPIGELLMTKLLESQARAQQKYRDKTKNVAVTFNLEDPSESKLLEYLERRCSDLGTKKASYVKQLIADDMQKNK